MQIIDFPGWHEVLAQTDLPQRLKGSFEITTKLWQQA
jgi:hypothetical protein